MRPEQYICLARVNGNLFIDSKRDDGLVRGISYFIAIYYINLDNRLYYIVIISDNIYTHAHLRSTMINYLMLGAKRDLQI